MILDTDFFVFTLLQRKSLKKLFMASWFLAHQIYVKFEMKYIKIYKKSLYFIGLK